MSNLPLTNLVTNPISNNPKRKGITNVGMKSKSMWSVTKNMSLIKLI